MRVVLKKEFISAITLETGPYRYFTYEPGKVYDIDHEAYIRNKNYYFDKAIEEPTFELVNILEQPVSKEQEYISTSEQPTQESSNEEAIFGESAVLKSEIENGSETSEPDKEIEIVPDIQIKKKSNKRKG
jgi:hypothetical protein